MRTTPVKVVIPETLDFSALRLQRHPDNGDVSFDWVPIEAICSASGIDMAVFRNGPEDNVGSLLAAWYAEHLSRGGPPDPVYDELLVEAALEDEHGGGFSHSPGQA